MNSFQNPIIFVSFCSIPNLNHIRKEEYPEYFFLRISRKMKYSHIFKFSSKKMKNIYKKNFPSKENFDFLKIAVNFLQIIYVFKYEQIFN
jgi:hypothetical protein